MDTESLPRVLREVQQSLLPYVKKRNEAVHIRRVLASHLASNTSERDNLSKPLSLIVNTSPLEPTSQVLRGIQKDFLRCSRSNIVARHEYALLSKDHQRYHNSANTGSPVPQQENYDLTIQAFLDLVKIRQTHERLCITQKYLNNLTQEPAASWSEYEGKGGLNESICQPGIPEDVLNGASGDSIAARENLHELVDLLEKTGICSH